MFRLLASYPKSGNTYVRIFLAHYLRGETDLNKIGWPIFSSRAFFPMGLPANRSDITLPRSSDTRVAKTHEVASVYYPHFIESAVYIVRNPIDVTPSWARHMNITNDKAIVAMNRAEMKLKNTDKIFEQQIGSWTTNVRSWLGNRRFPTFFIRYETLSASPEYGFKEMLKFWKIPFDEAKFKASIEFTQFANLQRIETEKGFKEARGSTGKFFNIGRAGNGKEVLSPEQIRAIVHNHGATMRLLDYAPKEISQISSSKEGEPVTEARV